MTISNLLKHFSPKKIRSELPEYSALRAVPNRGLPPDLEEEESGDSFTAKRGRIQDAMLESNALLRDDVPLFVEMMVPGRGMLTIPHPGEKEYCLPVFSSPYRAADYQQTLLRRGPKVHYLSSTAAQLAKMLRDFQGAGITSLALDRCPRCSTFTVVGTSDLEQGEDLLKVRAVHKATELARLELYYTYALMSARTGQLETALSVALETVGHVNVENPRPHLLVGELGVALGDAALVHEAQEFLKFFKHDAWEKRLADVVRDGQPRFEDLDPPKPYSWA